MVTLVGPGPCPPDVATGRHVTWYGAPDLPGRLRDRPGGRLWLNSVFTAISAWRRPDVLFFPWSVLPRLLVAPAVVTVHDVCFRSHPKVFPDGGRAGDRQLRAVLRSATAVLTPSAASKRGVVEAYGVEANRVTVVRHGVEPMFRVQPDPADRGADPDRRYFLCISTHEPRKNLEVLVRAYVDLVERWNAPEEVPDLLLVGHHNAYYTPRLRGHLDRSPRALRQTTFVESVSDARLAALYRSAIAVALPSVCEGFGFPLVEAVASGTPVIASDLPVFSELLRDGVTYVPPHDVAAWTAGLAQLASDSAPRQRALAAAASVAGAYSWRSSAAQTLGALERAARHRSFAGRRRDP